MIDIVGLTRKFGKFEAVCDRMAILHRDPARWTQLFLLGALIVLYVYNAYSFPMGLSALTRGDTPFGILGAALISIVVAVVPVRIARKRVGNWS